MTSVNNLPYFFKNVSFSRNKKAAMINNNQFDNCFCSECKRKIGSKSEFDSDNWHYCYKCKELFCGNHLSSNFNGLETIFWCKDCPENSTFFAQKKAIRVIESSQINENDTKGRELANAYIQCINKRHNELQKVNKKSKREIRDLKNNKLNGNYWK